MIRKLHDSYMGIGTTLKLALEDLFRPEMSRKIKDNIKQWDICANYQILHIQTQK